jgi:cyclic beta-1,2-glucan synthetase
MRVKSNAIDELFSPVRQYFQKDLSREDVNENPPLRSELFSADQMDQHAFQLASSHDLSHEQAPEQLLKRLADNEELLSRVITLLQEAVRNKKKISPAGEWLLDNYYLIEEQIRTGKRYLPKGYSKGLPKLKNGKFAGYPRVYDIAIEIISHSDGHVDITSLSSFILSYQKSSYLTIGELWAVPIMLRLALLENLSRVAARIAIDGIDARLANQWASSIIDIAENNPKDLVLVIADMARSNPPMVSAFVAEFARKIQWRGLDLTLPLTWIEQHLSDTGQTINSMVLAENQKQAADQLSVSNSIGSLRFLAKMNWREFVESISVVEQTLRLDPHGTYAKMDFYTRDDYRHQVERIAKQSELSEKEVAELAIGLAQQNVDQPDDDGRQAHVGYFLIGKGVEKTEELARVALTKVQSLRYTLSKVAPAIYTTVSILLTFVSGFVFFEKAFQDGVEGWWLVAICFLSLLAASQLVMVMVNWWTTLWIFPKPLPKMDLSLGIPNDSRTLIVIPTIIASIHQADSLVDDLEVRFLANRDPNLLFGLLTDFPDAQQEVLPEDNALVAHVANRIEELNERYLRKQPDTFFLFHRPRKYNKVENKWMGYERKRGKLTELNHLLRGHDHEKFSVIVGDDRTYRTVKYVITLDTDTQLPRDAAWKLIGLMSHPLNKARYCNVKTRVVEGYAIIQPRIAISLHGATRSRYTRMNENDTGIDPYTRVTSDVYQDVFHEGSFIGKGIYDIDAFEQALNNRFPENRILSHDLLEGAYARCAFASDVQLYEEYPSKYREDVSRRHRWIRGDWQIANWFLPIVPGASKGYEKNPISLLSKWKIFDNLRRSLVPVAQVTLFILGWTVLPSGWFWTLSIAVMILLPSVLISAWNATRKPKEIDFTQHINNTIGATNKNINQALFTLVCLPYEAFISIDAIIRTWWRIYISHKRLLEWNPSGFVQQSKENMVASYLKMWFAPIVGIAVLTFLILTLSPALVWGIPFLLSWIFSPAIVWWVSKVIPPYRATLSSEQKDYLRELSRKTWSFFENLVGPGDNWLPPDNLQQYPIPVIAHRTSPTNIGLALLANLSAHDFGYSTTSQLIERTSNTLSTMEKLERYLGHFYNWYDTLTLRILNPRYISTVDSGNLAGHLLTLRQGLLALPNEKIIGNKLFEGLSDTLRILIEEEGIPQKDELKNIQKELDSKVSLTLNLAEIKHFLLQLSETNSALIAKHYSELSTQSSRWITVFKNQVDAALAEIHSVAPWLMLVSIPEPYKAHPAFTGVPTLVEIAGLDRELKLETGNYSNAQYTAEDKEWITQFDHAIGAASKFARERISILQNLASKCFEFADMEYDFLYDKSQRLLTIGYSVTERKCDNSFYDLLASEARLSAFIAIAQGKLPQESWFALGRRLTTSGNTSVLLSWSGSMFEYLMPVLIMPTYENTLLHETYKGTVAKQIEYGRQQNVPWGVSESCYNVVDNSLTYQYRAFGIPGLGFKRGLGQDLVIAPYATVLSLMIDPQASYHNLQKLRAEGFEGNYGFYEAIDYTPIRLSRGQSKALIQTFMVHHQGMSLLSLAYLLLDQPMQKRFEADAQFQTSLLLLQEQVPKTTGFYTAAADTEDITPVSDNTDMRVIGTSNTPVPEVQLLSNGRYHVMVTNAGGGYSRWKDLDVTRWREDTTCDNWGSFCYIKDVIENQYWSASHQPTLKEAESYEAIFSQGRAEFRRQDHDIETHTEIIVSPEDDIEVRRIRLTNDSRTNRVLEITSYAEVVLATAGADASHPAFSNLFVQTEINSTHNAILCTRRARSKDERPPWMFHLMKVTGVEANRIAYETDRSKFIGRGNSTRNPHVIHSSAQLSGSQGSVLDPIASIQYRINLSAGESAIIDIITGASTTREGSQNLIDKYQDKHLRDRAFELSWTHSQVVLRQIGATEPYAQLYSRLASSVIYSNPALRGNPSILIKNKRGQSALWSYSISGDLPIVLLEISDTENITLVKQMIKAQAYWQLKGLAVDLVILNEDPSGYRQVLQDQIQGLIAAGIGANTTDKQGRVFVRPSDQVSTEDRILLQTVARVIISDSKGTLSDQVNKRRILKNTIPAFVPSKNFAPIEEKDHPQHNLQFFNGLGGFSQDGKEYVITLRKDQSTPLPWINVIANKNFGMVVSESGPSYTWAENAHEYRLTPWNNDPVGNSSGEAYYVRDEENGRFWSLTPLPARGNSPYTIRHGFGYSIFEYREDGIASEVCMYVDPEATLKFVVIKINNQSGRLRKLSTTGYAEWVLGGLRSKSAMHVVTDLNADTGSLIARNPYNTEFNNHVAFFDVDDSHYSFTTDRTEFIGRNGTLQNPDGLSRTKLSGKSGAGLDPCAAIQISFELDHGQEREFIFRMGSGKDVRDAVEIIQRFQGSKVALNSLEQVKTFWNSLLSSVQIETPEQSINILSNGWLIYQVLSSRLWGRSGFYQSGGAFGFRDQLQDVLALLHADPQRTRSQILLSASRQFKEGDVQHWWHPPLGRGVRTLCSDDMVWLAYVTARYVASTGDAKILDEQVSFLQGRQLNIDEESYYDLPIISDQHTSLYDHCKRAIHYALRFGDHGLPLIGSGDWNDGMNMVGIHGKGESVWLGFFLYDVLIRFMDIARLKNDHATLQSFGQHAESLKGNIDKHAWDGEWYRRAYFDDGTPLGSSSNEECKIDAIAQSWSVLSGAGEHDKTATAMKSVDKYLINRDKKIIQLLDPPFDKTPMDPGYIKGYVPGVRENGGQYTHAAIWMVMAFAKQGNHERTAELLSLINPIHHGNSEHEMNIYKVEPYVMAADVYGVSPHTGRGGWTWYTGSAAWMYQLILESFLGINREGDKLRIEPCVPEAWKSFTIHYRFKASMYHIHIHQDELYEPGMTVDNVVEPTNAIQLINDMQEHTVVITLASRQKQVRENIEKI